MNNNGLTKIEQHSGDTERADGQSLRDLFGEMLKSPNPRGRIIKASELSKFKPSEEDLTQLKDSAEPVVKSNEEKVENKIELTPEQETEYQNFIQLVDAYKAVCLERADHQRKLDEIEAEETESTEDITSVGAYTTADRRVDSNRIIEKATLKADLVELKELRKNILEKAKTYSDSAIKNKIYEYFDSHKDNAYDDLGLSGAILHERMIKNLGKILKTAKPFDGKSAVEQDKSDKIIPGIELSGGEREEAESPEIADKVVAVEPAPVMEAKISESAPSEPKPVEAEKAPVKQTDATEMAVFDAQGAEKSKIIAKTLKEDSIPVGTIRDLAPSRDAEKNIPTNEPFAVKEAPATEAKADTGAESGGSSIGDIFGEKPVVSSPDKPTVEEVGPKIAEPVVPASAQTVESVSPAPTPALPGQQEVSPKPIVAETPAKEQPTDALNQAAQKEATAPIEQNFVQETPKKGWLRNIFGGRKKSQDQTLEQSTIESGPKDRHGTVKDISRIDSRDLTAADLAGPDEAETAGKE